MKFGFVIALAAALGAGALAREARAQEPTARIRGYVFDSLLTGATLPGARVTLEGPTSRTFQADARGRFFADSLLPGRYTISFTHESLDQVGYTPPPKEVDAAAGVTTPVFVSTTAGHAIFAALCPAVQEPQVGVVLGQLTEVRTNRPIPDAEVRIEWNESIVSRELGIDRRTRAARSVTDSVGRYRICGVPNDVPVLLKARARNLEGPPLELAMEERPVAVRMLSLDLGDSTAALAGNRTADTGTAVLRGVVRGNDGKMVPEAQVLVLGLPNGTRTAENGTFQLSGLPGGTHTMEVRAIGYERRRAMIQLHPDVPEEVDLTLKRMAVVLPEVTVSAEGAVSEFDQRRRSPGGGHFITEDDIQRRNPLRTEDLFRSVPGFSVVPSGGFDYSIVSTRGVGFSGRCSPEFFVDGARIVVDPSIGGGLPVNPAEIHGIEAYSGGATIPAQYQTQNGCGVILIWTKRGQARRR